CRLACRAHIACSSICLARLSTAKGTTIWRLCRAYESEEKENKNVSQLQQTGCSKKLSAGPRRRFGTRNVESEEKANNATSGYLVSRHHAGRNLGHRQDCLCY